MNIQKRIESYTLKWLLLRWVNYTLKRNYKKKSQLTQAGKDRALGQLAILRQREGRYHYPEEGSTGAVGILGERGLQQLGAKQVCLSSGERSL